MKIKRSIHRIMMFSILLPLFFSACSSTTSSPGNESLDTPNQEELKAIVVQAFKKQYDLAHRIENTITTADKTLSVVIEYQPPDRYSILSEDNYFTQIIIIADKTYGYANETWSLLPIHADQLINPETLKELEQTIGDIRQEGEEKLSGGATRIYSYTSQATIGESKVQQSTRLWLGSADGLPYKITIDGQITSMDARSGKIEGVDAITTQVIIYDPGISINAPIP